MRCIDFWGSKHVGSGGMLPQGNFDFEPFFKRNLVESGIVFAQTKFIIYCIIKAFI